MTQQWLLPRHFRVGVIGVSCRLPPGCGSGGGLNGFIITPPHSTIASRPAERQLCPRSIRPDLPLRNDIDPTDLSIGKCVI